MRRTLAIASILLVACIFSAPRANAAGWEAPADEYFGPLKQSILEIRNRLDRLDGYGGRSALGWQVVPGLDSLEQSIADWQHKYPRDPWLPRYLAHLMHEYWRAGAVGSPGGRECLAMIRMHYPGAPETYAVLREVGSRR